VAWSSTFEHLITDNFRADTPEAACFLSILGKEVDGWLLAREKRYFDEVKMNETAVCN
jgi:hypothetical protein